MTAASASTQGAAGRHFDVLDGWRGVSILLVLATHLLPIGPHAWQLNEAAGIAGMSIFFILSGFLITGFLLKHDDVVDFVIRRVFRIVPLAWVYLVVALAYVGASSSVVLPSFLFYLNIPPFYMTDTTGHFWSLCVEMQFYAIVALLFALGRQPALRLLLPLCLAVTALRIYADTPVSIVTWLRLDDILAGCVLALVFNGQFGGAAKGWLGRINPYLVAVPMLLACHRELGALQYLRPYLAAALVGSTLVRPELRVSGLLGARWLRYVAQISFALYVIHPLLSATWLGSGATLVKYAKRPLLFVAIFGLAHLSTFHFERPAIEWGRRLSARLGRRRKLGHVE